MNFSRSILIALLAATGVAGAQPDPGKAPRKPDHGPRGEQAGKPNPRGEFRERRGPGGPRDRHPRAHAENFMKSHDSDQDDAVSYEEFQAGKKMQKLPAEGTRRIFDHLDKNKDGKITRAELPTGPPTGNGGGSRRGDTDGDGKISPQEFAENPRLKEVPVERRQEIFKRMDHDGDGFLTREDWRHRPDRGRRRGRGPLLDRKAAEQLDENGDKALSFEEWRKSPRLKEVGEDRLKEMFDRIDRNKDGKLDEADRPSGPPRRGPGGERSGPDNPRPGGPPRRPRPDRPGPKPSR